MNIAVNKKSRRVRWILRLMAAAVVICVGRIWISSAGMANTTGTTGPSSAGNVTTTTGEKATLGFAQASPGHDAATSATVKADVPTAPVEVITRPGGLRLTGVLVADEKSEVASNASGIVTEVLVDRGSMVKKGDVLARLDPTDANNQLAEGEAAAEELKVRLGLDRAKDGWKVDDQPEVQAAKAAMDLAAANYARYKELNAQKVIPKAQFDQAVSDNDSARQHHSEAIQQARQLYQSYKTALVRLKILRKAVEDTVIAAPFAGRVAEKYVSPGERITVGPGGAGKVALLLRIDPIRLSLTVPQQNTASVKPGQKVAFQVDSFQGRTFVGETRYLSPSVDNASRSMTVEATVANPDFLLRPGLFATAELQLNGETRDMLVPSAAVQKEGDVSRLFVARAGTIREVVVSAGQTVDNRMQILSGIEPNDRIVLAPDKVRDGDRIQ
jgi:membrane fusion protein, multidrug efflux system